MRILHLADGDPREPGVGGSAVRTYEVARRLAPRHQVTVLVPHYPGARARTEEGVRWMPVGRGSDRRRARLAYLAAVGRIVVTSPHDIIIEDFTAPFSVGVAPLLSRRPRVGVVHFLFAREIGAKYGLPFHWAEAAGIRFYDELIAVSGWLARELERRVPSTTGVVTIPHALEPFPPVDARQPEHLLFLGRLDELHKGLDLLVDALARARRALGERTPRLLVAGDGPDRALMERRLHDHELDGLVTFLGRVGPDAKRDLLARAYAVLVTSRFETFGAVAAESQMAGVPCVAFDIGPLAEVAGKGGTVLVPPFDIDAFAAAISAIVLDPAKREELSRRAVLAAQTYLSWDEVAERQEEAYAMALRPRGGRGRARRRRACPPAHPG